MDTAEHDLSDDSSQEASPPLESRFRWVDDDLGFPKTKLSDLCASSAPKRGTPKRSSPPVYILSDDDTSPPSTQDRLAQMTSAGSEASERVDEFRRKRKDSPDYSETYTSKRPLLEEDDVCPRTVFDHMMLSPQRPAVPNDIHTLSDSEPDSSDSELRSHEFDSQASCSATAPSLPPLKTVALTSKASNHRKEPARKKAITNENRLLKLQEKANKAQIMEKLRRLRPGNSIKYVTVVLDSCIPTASWGPSLIESFTAAEIKHRIERLPANNCITWDLNVLDSEFNEKHVLLIWSADQIITSVKFNTLIETFDDIKDKFAGYKIHLAIVGLQDAFKKIKRDQNKKFREACSNGNQRRTSPGDVPIEDIEMKLCQLLVISRISSRPVDNKSFTQVIHKMTHALSERPFKSRCSKKDHEYNYFARGDSRKCVRVDKDLNGLKQLWLQQLSMVTLSNLDIAKAIVAVYPTPMSLNKAYDACSTTSEKELLLQDLLVKRGWGPGATSRRIGPQMSKKVFLLFGSTDPFVRLSGK